MVRALVDRRLAQLADYNVFLGELAPDQSFPGTPLVDDVARQWALEADPDSGTVDASVRELIVFRVGVELGRRLGGAR